MKYLKIAMISSVVNFVANNRGNKIAILLLWLPFCFHLMKGRLWHHSSQAVEDGGRR